MHATATQEPTETAASDASTPPAEGAEKAAGQRAEQKRRRADSLFSYGALTPAFVILIGFTVLPFVLTAVRSFQTRGGEFTMENYERMIDDGVFHQVLTNNIIYTLVTVPATIAVSLGLAILGAKLVRGKTIARVSFLAPAVLPIVAAGTIWMYFYQPNFGVLNGIGGALGCRPRTGWDQVLLLCRR